MPTRVLSILLLVASLAAAAKKTVAEGKGENQDLTLAVTIYTTPQDVKTLIGDDLGGYFMVAAVQVEPRPGKQITLSHDDFTLRTDKDGEKATPLVASQIAGRGALVVKQGDKRTIGIGTVSSPVAYPTDYPGRYPPPASPGSGGPMLGVGTGGLDAAGDPEVSSRNAARDKRNPLEQALKDKSLPETKTTAPVSGLLYFCMEKQKMKDLELLYGSGDNRISIRFR